MRLEYPGRFLAEIEDYGIYQSQSSKALAVDVFFVTLAFFDGEVRTEYAGYKTRGRFWVVGRSGDLLEENVWSLADATGWDGDLQALVMKTWDPPERVQIVVEKEENDKGRTWHNAVRVFRADWKPATPGNVGGEDGQRIAATYTSALRSLVAKHRRKQGGDPSGRRTAPDGGRTAPDGGRTADEEPKPNAATPHGAPPADDSDIPF